MTLSIHTPTLYRAFTASPDPRRRWAAVGLLVRIRRVCEHEYGPVENTALGCFYTCALCGNEIEHDFGF